MGMKGKVLAVLVGVACVAAIAVTAASGATRAEPGITSNSILIGGTFPLTGVASLYKTIPAAEKAYFDYINDTKGGVNGRKINFEILDDAYDPSKTVPLVQQLVQQDKVWAIFGSLGTAPGLATWDYTNTQKVPQVFLATGDSYWGFCAYKKCGGKAYPWTINWQPDYPGEAKQYGNDIAANMPTAKIGVLYQNDAYGKNYYAGLRVGLGQKKELIVDAESYDVTQTSLTQQILAMKAKGADTLVIFATPSPTITALVTATKVGWKPTTSRTTGCSCSRPPGTARTSTASSRPPTRRAPPSTRTIRASSWQRRSSRSTRRHFRRASTAATGTSSTGWALRGRSSTRFSTRARTRPVRR